MRKPNNVDPVHGRTFLVYHAMFCDIEMHSRQNYCDRGAVEVHVLTNVERNHTRKNYPFDIDGADMFPRYYFDVDRAKAEMHDWMHAQKQFCEGQWEVKVYDLESQLVAALMDSVINDDEETETTD